MFVRSINVIVAITNQQRVLRKKVIAAAIRQLRADLGLTQLGLAQKLGHKAEPGMVSRWERGTLTPHPVYLEELKKLARRKGKEQLVTMLNDPLPNWRMIFAVNEELLSQFLTELETVVLSVWLYESPELNLDRLRRETFDLQARLVEKYRAGDEIVLWTDEQRDAWRKTLERYPPQQEIAGKKANGKKTTR
jgi:transcriptional regulator with XRE-family HTH domain